MQFQGLIGVPVATKATRLTWLVNIDFLGFLPKALSERLSISLMWLPMNYVSIKQNKEKDKEKKGGGGGGADANTLLAVANEEIEALKAEIKELKSARLIQGGEGYDSIPDQTSTRLPTRVEN